MEDPEKGNENQIQLRFREYCKGSEEGPALRQSCNYSEGVVLNVLIVELEHVFPYRQTSCNRKV